MHYRSLFKKIYSIYLTVICQSTSVFEKTCAATQKYVKSHVFLDFEKKRKKRTGHLITQPLIHNHRKSVLVSRQHQTFCSEMRTQETIQLRTVCDKRL